MATNINAAFASSGQILEGDLAQYSAMLYRTALRRVRNPADAEDAVQDAWLSACKHIDQFEGRSRFSTWLTTIVVNAAGSQLRQKARRSIVSLDQQSDQGEINLGDQLMQEGPGPEDIYKDRELRDILHGCLKKLSPVLQEAVQLVDLDGQSIREAASTLNIRIPALKSRLSRGRVRLAKALRQMLSQPPQSQRTTWGLTSIQFGPGPEFNAVPYSRVSRISEPTSDCSFQAGGVSMASSKNQSTSGTIATITLASANPTPEARRPAALVPSPVDHGRSSVYVLASMSGRRPELSGILKTHGHHSGSRF